MRMTATTNTCPAVTYPSIPFHFNQRGLSLWWPELTKEWDVRILYIPGILLTLSVCAYPIGLIQEMARATSTSPPDPTPATNFLPWVQVAIVLLVSAVGPILSYIMNLRFLEQAAKLKLEMREESDAVRGDFSQFKEQFAKAISDTYVGVKLYELQNANITSTLKDIKDEGRSNSSRLERLIEGSHTMAVEHARLATSVSALQTEVKTLGSPL